MGGTVRTGPERERKDEDKTAESPATGATADAMGARDGSATIVTARSSTRHPKAPVMSMPETFSDQPPRGHVRVIYLGPVAPHWDVQGESEVRGLVDEFRGRVLARLLLLPPHDPQFRRNKERVARDAEREALVLEWDLGLPEE